MHTPSESEHKSDTAVMVPTKQKRISPEKSCETNYYRPQNKLREDACHRCLSFCSGGGVPFDPKTPDTGPTPRHHTISATDIWWSLDTQTCSLEGLSTVVTPNGDHRNTYGWQAGSTHPTGMLSCLRREIAFCFSHSFLFGVNIAQVPPFANNKLWCSFYSQALKTYSNYQQ